MLPGTVCTLDYWEAVYSLYILLLSPHSRDSGQYATTEEWIGTTGKSRSMRLLIRSWAWLWLSTSEYAIVPGHDGPGRLLDTWVMSPI